MAGAWAHGAWSRHVLAQVGEPQADQDAVEQHGDLEGVGREGQGLGLGLGWGSGWGQGYNCGQGRGWRSEWDSG